MSTVKTLSMENFANGAAKELFDRELGKVMDNINDVNTDPKTTREITLTFKIKPDQMRKEAALSVSAKHKIAPVNTAQGQAFFGRNKVNGKLLAYGHNINQMELDVEPKIEAVRSSEASNVG